MNRTKYVSRNNALSVVWIIPLYLGIMVNCASAFAANDLVADAKTSTTISATTQAETSPAAGNTQTSGIAKKSQKKAKPKKSGKTQSEPIFAKVNGKPIPVREYDALYALVIQQRFYHGTIPEGQAEVVRKEVTDELVDRELLVGEAERRGIVPDPAKFEQVLADYDARYINDPAWQEERKRFLPELKEQVGRHSMVEQLEKAMRNVPQPKAEEVRAYYEQKPELFTEPENPRLSIILLKVDPSSPQEEWKKAQEEAQGIYVRTKGGADFAKEARLHSAHDSAANGGDMGYLHGGMLSEGLQEKIDKLQVGEISEPIRLLEGISLYRLEDRIPAKLQQFSAVEERAQGLLERDRMDQARVETIRRLRATAKIKFSSPSASGDAGKLPKKKNNAGS